VDQSACRRAGPNKMSRNSCLIKCPRNRAHTIWHDYRLRFDAEHFFRFGKSRLLLVNYQSPDVLNEENWKQFCMVAYPEYFIRNMLSAAKSLIMIGIPAIAPLLMQ
jgi:hypothetical protein